MMQHRINQTSAFIGVVVLIIGIVIAERYTQIVIKKTHDNSRNVSVLVATIEKCRSNQGYQSRIIRDKEGLVVAVSLYDDFVSEKNIATISSISTLETLTLGCCAHSDTPPSAKSFRLLKSAKLKKLVLIGAVDKLKYDMCVALSEIRKLETVRIEFCTYDQRGMDFLMKHKKVITECSEASN